MTPVSTRVVRLLNMVPYLRANPRITKAAAAADLGVSERQLEAGPPTAVDVRASRLRSRRPH